MIYMGVMKVVWKIVVFRYKEYQLELKINKVSIKKIKIQVYLQANKTEVNTIHKIVDHLVQIK